MLINKLFIHQFQSFPVAASSLCLLTLSIDRYVTVKHPRLAQFRGRQFLPSILATASWILGGLICIPFLLAYKACKTTAKVVTTSPATTIVTTTPIPSLSSPFSTSASTTHQLSSSTTFPYRDSNLINDKRLCVSDYGSNEWHIVFIVAYVSFVFVGPILGVIFNHIGNINPHNI